MTAKFNSLSVAILTAVALWANASEPAKPQQSREFEKMKTLVGTWAGKTDIGQGPVDINIEYRLLAGGSVLEERVFPGTPMEMVTMYYEKDGKLALTHYCVMGNRPAMLLKSSNDKTLKFDFDASCGINTVKEDHMHAMSITFVDADTVQTTCQAVVGGKETEGHPTTLKRKK